MKNKPRILPIVLCAIVLAIVTITTGRTHPVYSIGLWCAWLAATATYTVAYRKARRDA